MGKIKGTVLIEVVKFLRSRKEAGRAATPEHLHKYLNTRILANSWYPEQDYFDLLSVVAEIWQAPPGIDVWQELGRIAARSYLNTAYQMLVRREDPMGTLRHFILLWELRHDTGRTEITSTRPGNALVEIRDYVLVSNEICRAIQGTMSAMLECAGAVDVAITKRLCRANGDDLCAWQVNWRESGVGFR